MSDLLQPLRERYWRLLTRYQRWRYPKYTLLSPHAYMDAIRHHLPPDRFDPSRPMVMVDGGAHDGCSSVQFARHYPNLCVHTFEPNADLELKLKADLKHIPGTRNRAALAATDGKLAMQINESPMTSSVLAADTWSTKYFAQVTRPIERRTVDAISLDSFVQKQNIDRIDLIKLDLQGYEREALQGARETLDGGVGCIYTEVNFISFYQGCALFADIDVIMRQHGYRLYNIYHLATHHVDGQIGSADALFVRDTTTRPSDIVIEQPTAQPGPKRQAA